MKLVKLESIVDILDNLRQPINSLERSSRIGDIPYYGATGQVGTIDSTIFNENLLLLGEDGVPFFDRNKHKAYEISGPSWVNNHAHVLRVKTSHVFQKYLLYFLNNFNYSGYVNGATRLKLTQADMKRIPVPLPSLMMQEIIVKKLDNAFAEIDLFEKNLELKEEKTNQLSQSMLNAAFNNSEEFDTNFVKIGEVCNLMTGGTPSRSKPEFFTNGTIKWLVSGDINMREIFDCSGRITSTAMQSSNTKILPLNSVMIALNGQGKTRGKVAILRTEATCNQSLVSIFPKDLKILIPEFIFYNLNMRYLEIRRLTGDYGNDRRGLNMSIIRDIEIPLPPVEIQNNIVNKIIKISSEIEKLKNQISIEKDRISSLRQSILSNAFNFEEKAA
jgi:type I restriction enzyme S subunit